MIFVFINHFICIDKTQCDVVTHPGCGSSSPKAKPGSTLRHITAGQLLFGPPVLGKILSRIKIPTSRSLHCGRQSRQDWPEISSRTQSSLRQRYVAWCYFWHDISSLYLLGERPLSTSKSWGGPKREAETGTHDKGLKSNQTSQCITESYSGTRCSDSGCQFWCSASWRWGRRGEGEGPAKGSREGFSRGEDKQVGPDLALLFQNLHHVCFCWKRNSKRKKSILI